MRPEDIRHVETYMKNKIVFLPEKKNPVAGYYGIGDRKGLAGFEIAGWLVVFAGIVVVFLILMPLILQ